MKLIYIAGPYRPYTCADGTWVGTPMNIRNAEVTAVHLVDELGHLGLFPVVPHLNTRDFENQVKENHDQYFLDGTMALLERCDAVLLTMPNADAISVGTKAEVHRAHQLGIQVYRSFDALRRAAQEKLIVRLPTAAAFYPYTTEPLNHHDHTKKRFVRTHKVDEGWVVSEDGQWLPGIYETSEAAFKAADLNDVQLSELQKKACEDKAPYISQSDVMKRLSTSSVFDLSKLEEHVLATLTATPVEAINLRPGDTLRSGDVVNSTEQLEGMTIKVNWANGTSERYHYAEIFKVVMRRMGV